MLGKRPRTAFAFREDCNELVAGRKIGSLFFPFEFIS